MAKKYLDNTGLSYFWGKLKSYFVKKSGDTMTGKLTLASNQNEDDYTSGALDAKNSNVVGVNGVYFNGVSDARTEGIHFYYDATHVDTLKAHGGALWINPVRELGQNGHEERIWSENLYQVGTANPMMASMVSTIRANRLAFLPPSNVIIEQTIDGGNTWTDAGVSDSTKAWMFAESNAKVNLPRDNGQRTTNCGLRITITGMTYDVPDGTPETEKYNYWNTEHVIGTNRYCTIQKLWFWIGANGDKMRCEVYSATGKNPNSWNVRYNTDFPMDGWSGSDWIKVSGTTFGGGVSQTSLHWNWRIIFWSRPDNGRTDFKYSTTQSVYQIRGYGQSVWQGGSILAARDHLYSYDPSQNATFPAKVIASGGFSGDLTGNVTGTATNVSGTVAVANGGTGKTTLTDAANSFVNGLTAGTAIPTDNSYYISQWNDGSVNTYHRRPHSALWQYIKSKLDAVVEDSIDIKKSVSSSELVTSDAVKEYVQTAVGYVTPQMFGAYADGTSNNPHDDTAAIQAALDSSLEVYFPPGVYMVSSTLEIQNHAHIWGVMGSSKIRAIKNGFTIVNSQPTYMLQQMNAHGQFLIESLEFDCNDTANVCGFRFLSPYNNCVIRDCTVNNCGCFGINVGDPGPIDSSHRSQTLVVDNCLFLGSDALTSTTVLGYFRNAYELNLKDSKFMFSSVTRGDFCVEINNSRDVYIRGCSFVHGSNGIKLTEACLYFRLIANTYEDITTIPISLDGTSSAYVERGLIMETVYANVPKQIMMSYSRHIIVIGSFSTISKDANCRNITLLDMYNSDGTLPDKSAIEDRLNYRLQNTQQLVLSYSIATQTNSNVSPWGAFRSVSISSDISAYGTPIGVVAKAPANNNPAQACLVGTNLNAYSATAGTVEVYVTYNVYSSAITPWT